MSYQLAENIFPVGIHSPTWALRADDPVSFPASACAEMRTA